MVRVVYSFVAFILLFQLGCNAQAQDALPKNEGSISRSEVQKNASPAVKTVLRYIELSRAERFDELKSYVEVEPYRPDRPKGDADAPNQALIDDLALRYLLTGTPKLIHRIRSSHDEISVISESESAARVHVAMTMALEPSKKMEFTFDVLKRNDGNWRIAEIDSWLIGENETKAAKDEPLIR